MKALDILLDGVKNTCLSNGSSILIGCDKHEPEPWVYGIKTADKEVNNTDYFLECEMKNNVEQAVLLLLFLFAMYFPFVANEITKRSFTILSMNEYKFNLRNA